ncbi:hypothetical protein CYMTET_18046 [Cymbomonas tetramitiformis]|uniref:Uncharacterized protein n=1 Tax=Cymbomonas tetramitiformis TaxID=36881 RepID=A0AAE0L6N6_9CHLO|nr:hypothetical protein CYMTET_18046 [Cymbomonas tetramitiformis]
MSTPTAHLGAKIRTLSRQLAELEQQVFKGIHNRKQLRDFQHQVDGLLEILVAIDQGFAKSQLYVFRTSYIRDRLLALNRSLHNVKELPARITTEQSQVAFSTLNAMQGEMTELEVEVQRTKALLLRDGTSDCVLDDLGECRRKLERLRLRIDDDQATGGSGHAHREALHGLVEELVSDIDDLMQEANHEGFPTASLQPSNSESDSPQSSSPTTAPCVSNSASPTRSSSPTTPSRISRPASPPHTSSCTTPVRLSHSALPGHSSYPTTPARATPPATPPHRSSATTTTGFSSPSTIPLRFNAATPPRGFSAAVSRPHSTHSAPSHHSNHPFAPHHHSSTSTSSASRAVPASAVQEAEPLSEALPPAPSDQLFGISLVDGADGGAACTWDHPSGRPRLLPVKPPTATSRALQDALISLHMHQDLPMSILSGPGNSFQQAQIVEGVLARAIQSFLPEGMIGGLRGGEPHDFAAGVHDRSEGTPEQAPTARGPAATLVVPSGLCLGHRAVVARAAARAGLRLVKVCTVADMCASQYLLRSAAYHAGERRDGVYTLAVVHLGTVALDVGIYSMEGSQGGSERNTLRVEASCSDARLGLEGYIRRLAKSMKLSESMQTVEGCEIVRQEVLRYVRGVTTEVEFPGVNLPAGGFDVLVADIVRQSAALLAHALQVTAIAL